MTDPRAQDDDTWDELARELGLNEPARPPAPAPAPQEPATDEDEPVAEEIAEGESVLVTESAELDTEEGDEADEGDPEGTGEVQPGEGQPGTGRKRRRRRRRRKKGGSGAPQPAAEAQEPAGAIDETQEGAEEDEVTAEVTADRVSDVDEEAEEIEEVESAGVPLAAEEDTGSEVLRDLIANWNVPSWDDIVAGLYRPER